MRGRRFCRPRRGPSAPQHGRPARMDASIILGALAPLFALAALWRGSRQGWRGAASTWLLIAILFAAVALWLRVAG